jgi:hypothetical protein
MGRKKIKPKLGDVFTFPIQQNTHCFGQIVTVRPMMAKLYILFDFVSNEIPSLESIVKQPILAIAHLTDYSITEGYWTVIGNTDVALKNIVYPNYIMGDPPVVESYDGEVLRQATEEDIRELTYRKSTTSNIFEALAQAKFGNDEWKDLYDRFLFDKNKWVAAEEKLSKEHHSFETMELLEDPEADEDNLLQVKIRYKLENDGFGTPEDLEKRYFIEDILNESLRKTENGDCDGGEIGNGEMLIFCYVKNVEEGIKTIKQTLNKNDLLVEADITYSKSK